MRRVLPRARRGGPVRCGPGTRRWEVGLAIGLFSFGFQITGGLAVTGLTNTVTWGLDVVVFMFLVGVSSGGLIVVAGSELVGSHRLESLNRLAVIVSGTAVAAAAVSIIPDLGRPWLAWQMIVSPQPMSPLVWDMLVISSALVSGTALVLIVAWIVRRVSVWEPPSHVFQDLAKLLAWFVAVDFFLLLAELVTAYTSQTSYHLAPLEMLFGGRQAPLFWGRLVLGVLVPFLVYANPRLRSRMGLLLGAAVLSVLGVFAKRVNILMPGMYEPQIGLPPGLPAGPARASNSARCTCRRGWSTGW